MTVAEQLHASRTHKPGVDPACPVCTKAVKEMRQSEYRILVSADRGKTWQESGAGSWTDFEQAENYARDEVSAWWAIVRVVSDEGVRG